MHERGGVPQLDIYPTYHLQPNKMSILQLFYKEISDLRFGQASSFLARAIFAYAVLKLTTFVVNLTTMTLISPLCEKNGILEIQGLKTEKTFWHLTKEDCVQSTGHVKHLDKILPVALELSDRVVGVMASTTSYA